MERILTFDGCINSYPSKTWFVRCRIYKRQSIRVAFKVGIVLIVDSLGMFRWAEQQISLEIGKGVVHWRKKHRMKTDV